MKKFIVNYKPDQSILDFLSHHLGKIKTCTTVSGGLVHHVLRAVDVNDVEFYLKVRTTCYVGMPNIAADPTDIRHELKALRICTQVAPEFFPQIIASQVSNGLLLTSSVMVHEQRFLPQFLNSQLTPDAFRRCGSSLRRIHDQLQTVPYSIREDDDEEYYQNNLLYRIGYHNHPTLNKVIEKLKTEPRQLIHGDLSPKNLGFAGNQLLICDLDTMHRGNRSFDIGFFLGHVLVHALESPLPLVACIRSFLSGYNNTYDEDLVQSIALGIMLYRLKNPVVPYQINVSLEYLANVVQTISENLLSEITSWETVSRTFSLET